jgi:hypothetical protein
MKKWFIDFLKMFDMLNYDSFLVVSIYPDLTLVCDENIRIQEQFSMLRHGIDNIC